MWDVAGATTRVRGRRGTRRVRRGEVQTPRGVMQARQGAMRVCRGVMRVRRPVMRVCRGVVRGGGTPGQLDHDAGGTRSARSDATIDCSAHECGRS